MAKQQKQKVTFSYAAPEAAKVELVGDFTGWQQAPIALKKSKGGVWSKTVTLPAGRYEYRLLVDGEWRDDPQCPNRQPNQFGGENCVCVVEATQPAAAPAEKPAKTAGAVKPAAPVATPSAVKPAQSTLRA